MVKNGDLTFLLLVLILADEVADLLADLTPTVLASSGQEWQFDIPTVRARAHIGRSSGRSTGRSTPLVVASSGQEYQFYNSTVRGHIGR